jgi:glycosyltransferase involved in cell wall biosynthesis
MAAPPLRITHLITSLNTGGAQAMLYKLLSRHDREAFAPEVISLLPPGPIGEDLRRIGIPVHSLGLKRGIPDPMGVLRLVAHLRASRPQLLQTWMYHADLLGGLAGRVAGVPVVWNIRHSDLSAEDSKRMTRWTAAVAARLSRHVPESIVCCSEATRRVHAALGYDEAKMVVLPNGFDLSRFAPDPAARQSVWAELSLPPDAFLIGLFARFDPQKDHATFLRAAEHVCAMAPTAHFLLCGDDVTWDNAALASPIASAGLQDRFRLLGRRNDVPRLTAALDLAVLSSAHGEGFPNVLGEAMATGVPCVATDVGDSAEIVGDTGTVVAPRNAESLGAAVHAWVVMPEEARRRQGQAARARIETHYALPTIVERYEALYRSLIIGTAS